MWRAPIMCLSVNIVAAFTWWLCFEVDAYAFCPTTAKAQARAGRYTCTSSSLHRRREEYVAPLDMSSEEEQERASENKYLSVTKLSREQVWVRERRIHVYPQQQTAVPVRKKDTFVKPVSSKTKCFFEVLLDTRMGSCDHAGLRAARRMMQNHGKKPRKHRLSVC